MLLVNSNQKDDHYSVDELLQDDNFIASKLFPTQESDEYWDYMVNNGVVEWKDYELACRFIHSIKVRPEPVMDINLLHLWANIEVINKKNLQNKKSLFSIFFVISGISAMFAFTLWVMHTLKKVEGDNNPTEYHQFVVPYAKRTMITFAEGSRIWLNAGTQMIYPSVFNKKKREIYVNGEIYAEISPDHTRPFIVNTQKNNIVVKGTTFNLTAYENQDIQTVVLVSGSVEIKNEHSENKLILKPNEMYSYSNGIATIQTVCVDEHISWKDGIFLYKSERFGEIMKDLSHYYGHSILCSPQVSQLKFSGKLNLNDNLNIILDGITQISPIAYQYTNGVYTITNK